MAGPEKQGPVQQRPEQHGPVQPRSDPEAGRGLAAGLYRLLLHAYPRELRDAYGDEVRAVFVRRLHAARRRGPRAVVALWLREIRDALRVRLPSRTPPLLPGSSSPHRSPTERLIHAMDLLLQDLRFAVRSLRKNPGFTLAAVLVLAIGIGANAAIFSVVDAVLLEPLPYAEPGRLLQIWEKNPERGWDRAQAAAANFLDWREQTTTFVGMAAHVDWLETLTLTGDGEPEVLTGNSVTGDFFEVLGARMTAGTGFVAADDWLGGEAKVVLSHATWQQRFGGDPGVLGRRIVLDDEPHTIVGVAPEGFVHPFPAAPQAPVNVGRGVRPAGVEVWRPMAWDPAHRERVFFRRAHGLRVVGRLAPGATVREAEAELAAIAARLEKEYPETNTDMGTGVTPLHEWIVGDVRTPVLVLFAAVGFVLLIACANVANMQLVRASRRGREMALRSALGAARGRLLRQALTESLLLSTLGGTLGIGLGAIALQAMRTLDASRIPRVDAVSLDASVLGFGLLVTVITGLAFGLVPARRATATDLAGQLGSGRSSTGAGSRRLSAILVASEMALVLPMVIGVGLMGQTLAGLRQVDPGFDPSETTVFGYLLPAARYGEAEDARAFNGRFLDGVRALPGVESAALSSRLPFREQRWTSDFRAESWPADRYGINLRHDEISEDLFRTLRVPILRGRDFTDADGEEPLVAIVNRVVAETHFAGTDPVGERICFDREPEACSSWYEIVGVVDNVRRVSLAVEEEPSVYAFVSQTANRGLWLSVRSGRAADDVIAAVRGVLREVDPALPFHTVTTMQEAVTASVARERLILGLLGGFALVALVLGALGVYGVVSYATGRRTREIGVRVTLGARPADVLGSVLRQGAAPVCAGMAVGLLIAASSSRVLGTLLFGVAPIDPPTYVAGAAVLLATGLAACLIPARRALRIDPVEALREE